ncbi:M50 family metallopeptidase [Bacillus toyonensis]|uniref:M50 family metallopeptidase n=1 Tax=Bacillus toyonensis TaxID=155322 RepID=UPI002E1AEF34|nr:M50 family metallopeptidase [Bacillus toyonensis]
MTILNILIAILSFGFIVFFHELFHFLAAKAVGIHPKEFAVGFGKSIIVYQNKKFYFLPKKDADTYNKDEISYHIKLLPLGGYVLFDRPTKDENGNLVVSNEYFLKNHPLKRMFVALAGPIGNFVLAFILLFTFAAPYISFDGSSKIAMVEEKSLAATMGIHANDKIISINNKPIKEIKDVYEYVEKQEKVCISWEDGKGNKEKCIEKKKGEEIGFALKLSVWKGIEASFKGLVNITHDYVEKFAEIIFHFEVKQLGGPVGTVDVIQQSVSAWNQYATIMIILNIALGTVNLLLPLSITDGGRIIVDFICLIRRKRYITTTIVDTISVCFMLGLFILTFYLDIHRIFERFF